HKSSLGPGGIQQRRRMTFGKNETVVVIIFRILRVVPHVPEKQSSDQVRRGTARSWMSTARRRGCSYRVDAQLIGDAFQCLCIDVIHWICHCILQKAHKESEYYSVPHAPAAQDSPYAGGVKPTTFSTGSR